MNEKWLKLKKFYLDISTLYISLFVKIYEGALQRISRISCNLCVPNKPKRLTTKWELICCILKVLLAKQSYTTAKKNISLPFILKL